MSLIEGVGDEVTHFFIILIVVLIASVAWWTTNITEQRHVQTVWLLERRRQRRRLTNHTHSVSLGESPQTSPLPETEEPVETVPVTVKPPEPSTSGSQTVGEPDERAQIVQVMDADTCELRQRRLAFYDRNNTQPEPVDTTEAGTSVSSTEPSAPPPPNPSDITIKLKYINDDLRIVDGSLHEQLGDFKKRHFTEELASNKLVRLIFNGQVLHQDSKTLEGCGLFDNCVVHCLVHQRRPLPGEESTNRNVNESEGNNSNASSLPGNNNNNNNQGREWDLGNFFFAIITFTLLSAWYFRYVYAHLYTVTATVGLILMTGIFTIVIFGFYFPDHDHANQRTENPAQAQ